MIFDTEFDGGFPLGAIIQGINLPEPEWVQLGDRVLSRATWDRLSEIFPIGKLTGTVRTLAGAPTATPLVATAGHFVAAGATSALAVQYTADGVSWTAAATPSHTSVGLIAAGSRLISISSSANQPITCGAANPGGAWSAMTSGPTSVAAGSSMCRLAYSPTLGRTVVASGTLLYRVDDASTVWAACTVTGSTTRQGGCWTGIRFIEISGASALINLSSDAITWNDASLLEATSTGQGNIASNGAGVVVVSGSPSGLQVSFDHGATWSFVSIPGVPASDAWRVQFSGDRFFVPTLLGLAMSLDGRNWFLETTQVQAMVTASGVAKKGGVIAQVQASATAYSFSESLTEFPLPNYRLFAPAASGNPIPLAPLFIKAV